MELEEHKSENPEHKKEELIEQKYNSSEEKSEQIIRTRKERILNWLKEPYNLALVGVILFAFVIHFYYFILTKNQALWWDELSYGSIAKNFISHVWDGTPMIVGELIIRPLIFSYIWSFLMLLSLGEVINRFLLAFLPSLISVFFVYLIGKEVYGKKVGLIAAVIFSAIWINLFYSSRFLVHMLEMAFLFSSILFFIKSTKGEINLKQFSISLLLLSLATLTRYQDGMVFPIYFIVLIIARKLYLNKLKFWYVSLIGLTPLLLFFFMNYINFGNIFPALFGDYLSVAKVGEKLAPFGFHLLNYIPSFLSPHISSFSNYFNTLFLINGFYLGFIAIISFLTFFLIGLIRIIWGLILGYDLISENPKRRESLLLILILIVFFAFFIFVLRDVEDRYFFETLASLSIISALGIKLCADYLKKYSKLMGIIFLAVILIFGVYSEIKFASPLINDRKESFFQPKQAFEWIALNTPEDAVIAGVGIDGYAVYYSNRQYLRFPEKNYSEISLLIKNATYLVDHIFVERPQTIITYIQENNNTLKPVHVEFIKNQPVVIVYEILEEEP